jgi:hypothetical protein
MPNYVVKSGGTSAFTIFKGVFAALVIYDVIGRIFS